MSRRIALSAVLILVAMAMAGIVYVRKLSPVPVDVARVERDVEIRVFGLGSVEAQVLSRIGFQVVQLPGRLRRGIGQRIVAQSLAAVVVST